MEGRVTYKEIRAWFFECYYGYCRTKIKFKSPWVDGESEFGYAYGELESSFDFPIEKLMLEVLVLVFSAGRFSKEKNEYHINLINGFLDEIGMPFVWDELSPDEVKELKGDLALLGFLV